MKILRKQIVLYLIFASSIIYSQHNFSGIIHYESIINSKKVKKLLAEKNKNTKNIKLLKLINKSVSYSKPIKSSLKFSNGKGLYKVEDKMLSDNDNLGQQMAVLRAGGTKEFYFNEQNKTYLIKECEALGECFIFDNEYLEWQLTQEKKLINGYISYKATRSNGKVIAWYTPKIPVGFGPKGEYGLPGLILELEIGKIIFKASKIVLNPKNKVTIEEPKGGNRVSSEEYGKLIKKAKKSIFGN